jgi:glucose/arabinose dehydrogenase
LLLALTAAASAWAAPPPPVALEFVAPAVSPLYVTHAEDERLFIVQRNGLIRIYTEAEGVLPAPFLDLSNLVDTTGGGGLYTMAFHPDYAENGFFFVSYTEEGTPLRSVIARYEVSTTDPDVADPSSEAVVLRFDQPFAGHNNTQVAFGPGDGHLYVGTGDGGNFSPDCSSQRDDGFFGKILRLDVDSHAQDTPFYAIPPDNPYADPGDGVLDELWSKGLRHPWRFSFDPVTRDLLIADLGQFEREEVIRQPAGSTGGENYGWSVMEGTTCYDPEPLHPSCPVATPSCFDPSYTEPSFEYAHDGDCGIIGGYVYRGGAIPGLRGRYVFGDTCSKLVWMLEETGPGVFERMQIADGIFDPVRFGLTSFGEDAKGELYVTVGNGVYRLVFDGVPVDVRLRSFHGLVFPGSSHATRVALFGSDAFDVTDVDVTSLAFGPNGAVPKHDLTRWLVRRLHRWDLDGDGYDDLLLHFASDQTGLAPGDSHACLWGEADGGFFGGCDTVFVHVFACGLGFEVAFLVLPLLWLHRRRHRGRRI